MPGSSKLDVSQAIFDFDIACLHCGYNLRGLTQARCPECGTEFDPEELLVDRATVPKPSPGVLWTLHNVFLHPISIWQMPEVQNSDGPSGWYLLLVLTIASFMFVAGISAPKAGLQGSTIRFAAIAGGSAIGLIWLILFFALGVHMVLCLPAMPGKQSPRVPTGASAVVGYSAAWIIPAMAGVLAAIWTGQVAQGVNVVRTSYILLIVTCLLWAITLYAGGMARTSGRRMRALWCVISNPFWYAVAWILWML